LRNIVPVGGILDIDAIEAIRAFAGACGARYRLLRPFT